MFDFIGDIHGHADQLEELLKHLGYTKKNSTYSHPERKAFFIGDYIDRGPKIKETLNIVRNMVESDNAKALMGNHEYNAILFKMEHPEGGHLRKHEIKNVVQHVDTLKEFLNNSEEFDDYINWFNTLPLYYEDENFRAVHACWDDKQIDFLRNNLVDDRLNDELIYNAANEGTDLYNAIEDTLKGKEMKMPGTLTFKDKGSIERSEFRMKWWEDPRNMTYKAISVEPIVGLTDDPIELHTLKDHKHYSETAKKVFFGHYWLHGEPQLYRDNICCLDYSVAKEGKLVAYRFDGEDKLENGKLVYV
jgi:predicted MPP superfamily phosphohydrolase